MYLRKAITIVILGLGILGSYGFWSYHHPYVPIPPYEPTLLLATYSQNGVDVTAWLEYDQNHHPLIATTFAPQQADFHLYGQTLPISGIDGLGRPTDVVLKSNQIRAKGTVYADVMEKSQIIGDIQLPVYPEGPVTLRIPVSWDGSSHVEATLNVTYMACSDAQGCLLPVMNHPIPITLPISEVQ